MFDAVAVSCEGWWAVELVDGLVEVLMRFA